VSLRRELGGKVLLKIENKNVLSPAIFGICECRMDV
jgi:hypothetical protein